MAQVEQVNINNYEMEMIPKLGKHIIHFGEGTNAEAKFNRLLLFYKQIMSKTGWNYYSALDLRYDKQLVAVRRDSASLFKSFVLATKDSIRINNVIDSLQIANDTSLNMIQRDSIVGLTSKTMTQKPQSVPENKQNPAPVKTESNPSSIPMKNQNATPVKTRPKPKTEEENVLSEAKKQNAPKPKAVMEKKNQQNSP